MRFKKYYGLRERILPAEIMRYCRPGWNCWTAALCHWENARIRAQAILAFSLLAVYHGYLDREIVEPIILKEWHTATPENKSTIENAVDDINFKLRWALTLP